MSTEDVHYNYSIFEKPLDLKCLLIRQDLNITLVYYIRSLRLVI